MQLLSQVIDRLILLTKSILPLVILGIIGGNILIEFGLTKKLSKPIKPFLRISNLPDKTSAPFITLIASGAAAYSMFSNFYEKNYYNEKQIIVAVISSTFFSYLGHIPTYYLPFVLPVLGLKTGLMYLSIELFVGLMITLTGALIGYRKLNEPNEEKDDIRGFEVKHDWRKKIKSGTKKSIPTLKKIVPRLVIIYLVASIALSLNLFDPITNFSEPVTKLVGLPGESSTIIALRFVDVYSSIILAGNLLSEGVLTSIQIILALLVGGIISIGIFFFRYSLPEDIAYFGAETGTKIALISLIAELVFRVFIILFVFIIF
ncbi:MAG: putative membrane protein [Candidatus Methanohalarchaeum thermophilum]|uniref:Membrane protein n=1 Tax=Methanohalarchaeum thermophilum TaxID=1903181 RepID=A0A1Q6DVQ0_METT1|nr:MAG: putative membrane protein [Candidatus Methanohalarchaeum thermophilum]